MSTTVETITSWLKRADDTHSHMIVVCDTYDFYDYPVFVKEDEDIMDVIEDIKSKDMTRIMEVYKLCLDLKYQLSQRRAYNL